MVVSSYFFCVSSFLLFKILLMSLTGDTFLWKLGATQWFVLSLLSFLSASFFLYSSLLSLISSSSFSDSKGFLSRISVSPTIWPYVSLLCLLSIFLSTPLYYDCFQLPYNLSVLFLVSYYSYHWLYCFHLLLMFLYMFLQIIQAAFSCNWLYHSIVGNILDNIFGM